MKNETNLTALPTKNQAMVMILMTQETALMIQAKNQTIKDQTDLIGGQEDEANQENPMISKLPTSPESPLHPSSTQNECQSRNGSSEWKSGSKPPTSKKNIESHRQLHSLKDLPSLGGWPWNTMEGNLQIGDNSMLTLSNSLTPLMPAEKPETSFNV